MEEFSVYSVGFGRYGIGDGPGWVVEICLKILSLGVECVRVFVWECCHIMLLSGYPLE